MKKNIIRILCLALLAGTLFAACEKENSNNKYTVTVNSADETMGKAYGGGQFDAGTTTQIWGTPEVGYQFDHWNDGNTDNPRNITVNGDITYTAYFTTVGGGDIPGGGGDIPGGGGDIPGGGGDNPGDFSAILTVNGIPYECIAVISYGMDQETGSLLSLQLILGEGSETDPSFYLYILPQSGIQGFNQGASCSFIENADDFVMASNGNEYPHYQTISSCNYSINVNSIDMSSQYVSLTSSGELFDIRRAENGEGAHTINYSVTLEGYWQYPSSPSDK